MEQIREWFSNMKRKDPTGRKAIGRESARESAVPKQPQLFENRLFDHSHLGNCLPMGIGSVPHLDAVDACDLVLRNFVEIPFWPQLPKRNYLENMYVQFSEGLPGLKLELADERVYVDRSSPSLLSEVERFYADFLEGDPAKFAISKEYAAGLYTLLGMADRLSNVRFIKGQVTGPVSFGLKVTDRTGRSILYDDAIHDVLVKILLRKAQWQERVLTKLCQNVVIFVDEPYLAQFGSAYISLSREEVIRDLEEVLGGIKGLKGVHCCGNTDWSLLLGTSANIISFDAYNYATNLALYIEEVRTFLDRGGIIAWGIVPANEEDIAKETVETLVERLKQAMQLVITKGIPEELVIKSSLVTPSCGTGSLSMKAAQEVLEMACHVSQKMREIYGLVEM